ncbi:hypothetical protein K440DRAFT_623589 [Wilcoxina mikolae CBS 423.85]|nr:hypothetical protein K440DRAFT_623589 [Wilcoxina mikolae CBS 423.85]
MSPGKRVMTPRKSRASKATAAKDSPLKKEVTPIFEREETSTITTTQSTVLASTTLTNGALINIPSATTPVKQEPLVKVEVEEAMETNGDVEIKTTHVKVELPTGGEPPSAESTKEMLDKAHEMVAEARKFDGESTPSGKRKVDDIDDAEEQDEELEGDSYKSTHVGTEAEARKAKRAKVLEAQLRKEKVKNRALLGLSATLAIGALLPYVL